MYHQAGAEEIVRILAVLLLLSAAAAWPQQKLMPLDENGYQPMIQSNAGKVALVDMWATWCAPCRKEMPLIVRLEARLRDKGFQLVTISADEPEQETAAADFLKKIGAGGKSYLRRSKDDDKFIRTVDPKWNGALPAQFLYDRQGKLVKSFTGETDIATIEAAIKKLL